MIRMIVTLTITGLVLAYSLAVYLMWPTVQKDHPDWSRKRVTWYALGEGAGLVRDYLADGLQWLLPRMWHGVRHGARRARIRARSGRAAVNRRLADRRRPPVDMGSVPGGGSETAPRQPSPRSAPGPRERTVVTPIRKEPVASGASPGPAPAGGGTEPVPPGAMQPAFGALITWILDQDHPDSIDFEAFHRDLSSGVIGVGEALHEYTEHLAEGGIGMDPLIVQASADVAEAFGELSAGIVDIFRKFHAVYAGYLAWLEDGHQNTHDGRWVRPESA